MWPSGKVKTPFTFMIKIFCGYFYYSKGMFSDTDIVQNCLLLIDYTVKINTEASMNCLYDYLIFL
jgi:hypothetical protein